VHGKSLWSKTEPWLFIRESFFAWTRTSGLVPIRIASPSRQETFSLRHATHSARATTSGLQAQTQLPKARPSSAPRGKASADGRAIGAFRTGVGTNRSEHQSVTSLTCQNPEETRVFSKHFFDGTPLAKGQLESLNSRNIDSIIWAIAVGPFTRGDELRVRGHFG